MEICLSLSPWCCDLKTRATTLSIRRLLVVQWFLSFTALSQKLFIFSHHLISFGPTLISSGLRIQKGSEGSHQTANLSCTGEKSEVAEQTDKPWLCHREADSDSSRNSHLHITSVFQVATVSCNFQSYKLSRKPSMLTQDEVQTRASQPGTEIFQTLWFFLFSLSSDAPT